MKIQSKNSIFARNCRAHVEENRHKSPAGARIRLPFDNRRGDAGEWAYDHRAGLCVTIILYLLLAILFVASKIVLDKPASSQGIYIDLSQIELLEDERDRLQREVQQNNRRIDWSSIRNAASNENALNENLATDRGSHAAELNSHAADAADNMRANREAYERGLAEATAIGQRSDKTDESAENRDRKIKGTVTVTLSIKDPVRYSRNLVVPAYRCEGGGEVVVRIGVDRAGRIVSADVVSGGDECMRTASLNAARASSLNIDESAPVKQYGTITYMFIPQ